MAFKDDLLDLIDTDPAVVRDTLQDKAVQKALASIGILLDESCVRELHHSGLNARKDTGKGDTLCGKEGIRHPTLVTCKNCLKKTP